MGNTARRGQMTNYHNPVMLHECIEGLNIKPDGIYVDVTFGGGGHSREILKNLGPKGRLIAFDQDADAQNNLPEDDRLTFIDQNFRYLKNNCRLQGVTAVDGILADLGVSSHQFDQAERGFSIRFDAELDMRMDQAGLLTAKEVRLNKPINTVQDLKTVIAKLIPKGKENKYLAQVFQALRIEVNQELEALKEFLEQTVDILKPEGRLVIMSYHSLEDRLVKNFIAKGKFHGEVEVDFFGNQIKPLESLTRKAIVASDEEIAQNNRARSAKLRIAVKNN
ncbi:putative ribosomal R small subunit methyltransferase H-like [Daphnia sinensis]|uniref:Ribosomal R small subunit methyltransferase H-like n=1 Tax=Daphnia sinensis TaxID=1820382 RepID=A0AAD5PL67_9CRUS|nr:putative ribosomal R small subunit methyltransferase H-like [Daphnia sinensis]